jgi:hypothetical protein
VVRYVHPEFRTVVAVAGGLTVTGVLPGTEWQPEGSIAISGDVRRLWREQAGELADALRLVAERMDACAQQRYGSTAVAVASVVGGLSGAV